MHAISGECVRAMNQLKLQRPRGTPPKLARSEPLADLPADVRSHFDPRVKNDG